MSTHHDDEQFPGLLAAIRGGRVRDDEGDDERRVNERRQPPEPPPAPDGGEWERRARIILMIGVPSVIALFLVWALVDKIDTKLEAHAAEARTANAQQLDVLRQICVNTSASPEARAVCWQWRVDR